MDYRLFHAINSLAGHIDGVDDGLEVTANFVPFVLIGVLAVLWFLPGNRQARNDRQWACVVAVGAASLAMAVNQLIGLLWQRPRPFVDHRAVLLIAHGADGSFPSDHAAFAFAVATAVFLVDRRIGTIALALAAAMGFARVYVGVHYVSDVVVGATIGILMAAIVHAMRPMLTPIVEPCLAVLRRSHLA